jgi:hypothetical protein
MQKKVGPIIGPNFPRPVAKLGHLAIAPKSERKRVFLLLCQFSDGSANRLFCEDLQLAEI